MFQYSRDNGFIVGVMFRSKSTWSSQARRDKQGKISGKHLKKCGKPNDSHPDWVYYRVYPWVMGWFEIPPKWLDVLGEWDGLLAAHSQRQQTLHASQLHVFAYRSCFLSFFLFFATFFAAARSDQFFARRMLTWSKFLDMMARPPAAPRQSLQALPAAGPFVATEVALVLRPWVTWDESRWFSVLGFI